MKLPKIGDPGTFVPSAFIRYEELTRAPVRLACRIVYVNAAHRYYTVEGECNGYRIRESYHFQTEPQGSENRNEDDHMGKNDLIERMAREKTAYLNYGQDIGYQMAMDILGVCLHRQGWGAKRLARLIQEIGEASKEYADAYHPCMEQDVMQERMDRELRAALGDPEDFVPFVQRYPGIKTAGYDRLPKKRRH